MPQARSPDYPSIMTTDYDVIVLGVGTMGAAAAYHLSKRGVSVLGLEQHAIPHLLGAHHGFSRMIRLAYYEHPDYVPLLRRAYELWDALEEDHGEPILRRTGGLYMGIKGERFLQGAIMSAQTHGLAYDVLSPPEIQERYPVFDVPDTHAGFFEEAAGFLVPETAMAAHVLGALRRGAELRGHVRVSSWETEGSGVVVQTADGETFSARHLLITAGAWSQEVLGDLALDLTVTRQAWGWFWPQQGSDPFQLGKLPCWFVESPGGGGHYGFPMMPDNPGFKLALHQASEVTGQPGTIDRQAQPEDEAALRAFLNDRIPSANGNLLAIRTCLYTNSPDGHFILDQHPASHRVTLACGFSGHGFKFASVMGEVLADLATEGQTTHPIDFLGLDRLR